MSFFIRWYLFRNRNLTFRFDQNVTFVGFLAVVFQVMICGVVSFLYCFLCFCLTVTCFSSKNIWLLYNLNAICCCFVLFLFCLAVFILCIRYYCRGLLFHLITHTWTHTHSVGFSRTKDRPVAASTCQHTTITIDKHPCPQRDSNPKSQQASGRRPKP